MHEIFIINIFCILQSLIETKSVQPTFLKIFFKFAQIFEVFDHSPFSPKARSMAERCHRKRRVKFSIVFVTVRFFYRFERFRQKSGVKLCVFGKSAELN
jgi:hypothetical protein